jgi:elongation factor 1 alpha-like protein
MSRHKNVRNLDLDNELDDFDGGEDYSYDGLGDGSEGELLPKPGL